MTTKIFHALAAVALGGTALTAGAGAAQAAPTQAQYICHVNTNNVNYRSGPGTQYPSYGQVHYGQTFDGRLSTTGGWMLGNLPGIRNGVWIQGLYITC
ncbi:MAG TPA: hypothetical protein VGL05_05925 [Kribbella sp.]